jgi:hypothetical protein
MATTIPMAPQQSDTLELKVVLHRRVQRPILVIRSTVGELGDQWINLLDQYSTGPWTEIHMPIPEVPKALDEVYGSSPEDQAQKENEAFGELPRRVYNAGGHFIRTNPGELAKYQVVVEPYSNPLITLLVMQLLRGLIGKDAWALNSFVFRGEKFPNTKVPFLDPASSFHAGKKLREVEGEVIATGEAPKTGFNGPKAKATAPLTLDEEATRAGAEVAGMVLEGQKVEVY